MLSTSTFLSIFSTIFGLLIGSFMNVVIHRMPLGKSVVTPRSSCPKCGHIIKWYENIPVVSYIFLKGKCAKCKSKISIRYPLLELFVGCVAYLLAPNTFDLIQILLFVFYFSVACIFISHFLIDIEHQILPDKINLYFLAITIPYVVMFIPLGQAITGAVIGFGGTYAVTWIFWKLRGQIGLGGGDIKLYGILGLLLGPMGILNNIFLSCTLGALFGVVLIVLKKMTKQTALPFGPFIIIVATLQIFFPEIAKALDFFAVP